MEGSELIARLAAAERSQRWLAEKLGVSHTQIQRWLVGELPIPPEKGAEARLLLPAVMQLDVVRRGAIVRPASEKHAHRRLKIVLQNQTPRPFGDTGRMVPGCRICGRALQRDELVARDINGNGWDSCVEHVVPAIDNDEEGSA